MSNSITKWIFITILSFLINPDVLIQGQRQVPCLFFFGDSLFENGNNNDLITVARSNYPPYGIDYPGGLATGRPTNGRNLADFLESWIESWIENSSIGFRNENCEIFHVLDDQQFIFRILDQQLNHISYPKSIICVLGAAQLLGFANPIPPFVTARGSDILRGVNYASGVGGILDGTGANAGERYSLNQQLQFHQTTIDRVAGLLGNRTAADRHLRQCLYVVNIGNDDYVNNYYLPLSLSRALYSEDAFAQKLIQQFSQQLRTLYNLGSRKTAVFGITLLGCIPQELSRYSRNIGSSGCVDFINNGVQLFNTRLISLIKDLNNNLPNARFTYLNITDISSGVPSATGIRVVNAPCCEVNILTGLCARNGGVCSDRNEYAYFNNYHPTEILYNFTATRAYAARSPSDAIPVDIRTLIQE